MLIMLEIERTCSRRSVWPRSSRSRSSSLETSKWSSMAFLPLPVTIRILVIPEATASSITYWMIGLSTRGSISLGWALVAGRKRVPSPAAGNTAFRIFIMAAVMLPHGSLTLRSAVLSSAANAGPQVRGGEQGARARGAGEPRPEPRADPGLARSRRRRPLDARRGSAGGDPEGRAAPAPAASGGRGDRAPGPGEGGRLRTEGRDEGGGGRDQGPRGPAAGGRRGDPQLPAHRPQYARCERSRGDGCFRQPGGPARGRAEALRVHPPGPLGPRARAGDPGLRTGGPALRGALRGHERRRRAARTGPHPVHARPAHLAGLPRDDPALPRHRGDPRGHRTAPEVRGRPLQDARRGEGPLLDPHRGGAAHRTARGRDPRDGSAPVQVRD